MMRRTLAIVVPVCFVLCFMYFRVISAQSFIDESSPSPISTFTPQPTHMPEKQQILYGSRQETQRALALNSPFIFPIRGIRGDWWADVIIGQPNFSQITPNQVVGNKLFNPGGVYVDRSFVPNRIYIYDGGNSRILGFSSIGVCTAGSNAQQNCTSNSDCPGSSCAVQNNKSADIILGQPSSSSSACNGDSGFQNYPNLPAPDAQTLCGLRPESVSILEGGSIVTMASDSQGNFYTADFFNNRVLRYNNPFINDSVADYVWGQSDFTSAGCNMGASYEHPNNKSLCLAAIPGDGNNKTGVAVDLQGNLWVADTQNNRVLRFPFVPALGAPAQTADLVLGQQDFNTATSGGGINQMSRPRSVRVDNKGNVYVADGEHFWTNTIGRILIFQPPLSNGMSASKMIQNGMGEPTALELDPKGGFWVNDADNQRFLKFDNNGNLQQTVNGFPTRIWGGIGIDRDSNLMVTGWDPQEVQIYRPPTYNWVSTFLQANEYGSFNQLGPLGMTDPNGLEVTSNQLMVSDGPRLLFWNNPTNLTYNYPPATGVVGQPDFLTRPQWDPDFGRMRADTHGRLWVVKGQTWTTTQILAYQLPLVTGVQPIIQIPSPIPLLGGGSFSWSGGLVLSGIAYQPGCDCLWLSDRDDNRVFRIRNISTPQRVVDIVLGQKRDPITLTIGIHCNQGRDSDDLYVHPTSPSQDSLCHPGGLTLDEKGNLFVSDHNLEIAGNWRMLEYDAANLPTSPATAIFDIPASQVYGRNGSFTEPNCLSDDPTCGSWEPVFDSHNQMVLGFNGYLGPHFPQVYLNPLINPLPYSALMDFYSHAYSARVDSQNNLYVLDMTRDRVLIYWVKDTTPPIVHSIERADPNPNTATSVHFTVTFSEPVFGVDKTDFNLTTSGLSGTSIIAVSGSGSTRTVTVGTGSGHGTLRLNVEDNDTIIDGAGNPLGGKGNGNGNYSSGQKYTLDRDNQFVSAADQDGWILESGETSGKGGSLDTTGNLRIGDDASKRQYLSILSFNTTSLPDNATIIKVTLKIRKVGVTGTDPFTTHGNLLADIVKGTFGSSSLQIGDFQATASKANVGPFTKVSGSTVWYQLILGATNYTYINKTGLTQFRLHFTKDDDDDLVADYVTFYAGDATTASNQPSLIIEYTLP